MSEVIKVSKGGFKVKFGLRSVSEIVKVSQGGIKVMSGLVGVQRLMSRSLIR